MRRLLALCFALILACEPQAAEEPRRPDAPTTEGDRIVAIEEFLTQISEIADDNGGTRYAGSPGYDASVELVADRLEAAGYEVTRHRFDTAVVRPLPGSRVTVGDTSLKDGRDLRVLLYSPPGRVSGPLHPIDFAFDVEGRDGPACEDSAFAGMPRGAVVLIRPGPCFTRDQVVNAGEAGAAAILVSYPEFHTGEVLRPTLLGPQLITLPALAVSDEAGELLAREHEGDRVTVEAQTTVQQTTIENVIAEGTGGDEDSVVMFGGHLDSVVDGPGINDNGSGVATLLALAEELDHASTGKRVRFAFWGAEELGLLGSTAYVNDLAADEVASIEAYVNFDMVASPNFVRWIYDEEGSPPGSDDIAALFDEYFDEQNLTSRTMTLGGASDHGPFLRAGIPIGGIYSGSDEIKTRYLERVFRGEAGEPLDPCYHQACDDLDNINREALEEMAGAAAHVIAELAG